MKGFRAEFHVECSNVVLLQYSTESAEMPNDDCDGSEDEQEHFKPSLEQKSGEKEKKMSGLGVVVFILRSVSLLIDFYLRLRSEIFSHLVSLIGSLRFQTNRRNTIFYTPHHLWSA